ncbi:MAG: SDR family NAD(P)-dependent oxidoreductase [Acidobacteriota bacterium]
MSIRFDDRVAIVTGAGNGLGRSHALGLAARGAKVVVNDLGGARDGTGASGDAAREVVDKIVAAGGEAFANGADVTEVEQVEAMVRETVDTWGRLDILVNNAGILRDKTFQKMPLEDFEMVLDVHLMGTVHCIRASWGAMREAGYGRVVVTTSSSGLYGNFGQSNYGAAKLGLVGLMKTLAQEGAKHDIRVNALAPCAATRMTEDLLPAEVLALLAPEAVSAGLLALVAEDAPNGAILSAGAGVFALARIFETQGVHLPPDQWTPEAVAERWQEIGDTAGQRAYQGGLEQTTHLLEAAAKAMGIDPSGGGD